MKYIFFVSKFYDKKSINNKALLNLNLLNVKISIIHSWINRIKIINLS